MATFQFNIMAMCNKEKVDYNDVAGHTVEGSNTLTNPAITTTSIK